MAGRVGIALSRVATTRLPLGVPTSGGIPRGSPPERGVYLQTRGGGGVPLLPPGSSPNRIAIHDWI